jgi:hypothetical protein
MNFDERRAYARVDCQTPVIYAYLDSDDHFDAEAYNCSDGGMYFEAASIIEAGTHLYVRMKNFVPGAYGPEAYEGYRAEVIWCRAVQSAQGKRYGVGVRYAVPEP